MRLLFLMQGKHEGAQPGYVEAVQRLQKEGILEAFEIVPYYNYAEKYGWSAFWSMIPQRVKEFGADSIFFQFFHDSIPCHHSFFESLRRDFPNIIISVSCGDGFGRYFRPIPKSLYFTAAHSDVTFMNAMGYMARSLVQRGAQNIVLVPNGYCQVRFNPIWDWSSFKPEYDVIFIGGLNKVKNPLNGFPGAEHKRSSIITALSKRYGSKFAVYGPGWKGCKSWLGPLPYAEQHNAYRFARVIFGGYPRISAEYYTSDRALIALSSGISLVDWYVPRVDKIWKNGVHWHLVNSLKELFHTIDRLLDLSDMDRIKMSRTTAQYMANGHSQYHRMRLMVRILKSLCEAHSANVKTSFPQLDYFLPEADLAVESNHAIANWHG